MYVFQIIDIKYYWRIKFIIFIMLTDYGIALRKIALTLYSEA